jgi:hypothetical protein
MQCPDCGGTSTVEVVSILLAAGAFVVSIASLWLTSLRRPNVTVDRIATDHEVRAAGWSGAMVSTTDVVLHFYVANSGASGTVVERLELLDFREVNDVWAIWSGVAPAGGFDGVTFPLAMERDDATMGRVRRQLRLGDGLSIADAPTFAARLAGLLSVVLTLEWTFRRPRLFRPWRHEVVRRRSTVMLNTETYRRQNIEHWRSAGGGDYARLANIAEGRES